jgi:ribosomal protein S18 acetylase RimI-like enzyme/general stress protein CsbA
MLITASPDQNLEVKVDLVTLAVERDLDEIRQLDQLCFPPGDLYREPAAPGELEEGIGGGRVSIVKRNGQIVGFLQYEQPLEDHIYISALGVHPDAREQQVGRTLLKNLLSQISASGRNPAVSTVTGPSNYAMLRLLLSQGFLVRTIMRDYFGPGRDRFYCQYKVRTGYVDPDDRYLIPVHAIDHIAKLMTTERYVITSVITLPTGPAFEVCKFERDDVAALQSDECAASITFSAGALGAITFILGFSFVSSSYPDDVRVLLIGSAVITTFSLIIYANASGELSRLRSNIFSHYMKWGNLLSEYGGALPFLITLPVILASVTNNRWVALAAAAIVSLALVMYERSHFAIASRFRRTLSVASLEFMTCSAPITGVLAVFYMGFTWPWTAVISLALMLRVLIYLIRRPAESGRSTKNERWAIRD